MSVENLIIADPCGENYEFAERVYERLREKSKGFEFSKVNMNIFRDGELKPKIEHNIRKRNCFFIHDSNKKPADWFLQLSLVNYALKYSSASQVIDVLPYLKFSRQDRKDESRVPISSRVVADVVSMYADGVVTIDVHNPAIAGFYNVPFDNLFSYPTAVNYIQNFDDVTDNLAVMSTDAGGGPRAKAFAKKLGIEDVAICYKYRPKAGEVGAVKILGDVEGKNVLIVDDMIDSGGSLLAVVDSARKEGAKKVYCYATHGLFTKGTKAVTDNFDYVFVGDTIKQKPDEKLKVISFTDLFAEAIFRISEGESLSKLFD